MRHLAHAYIVPENRQGAVGNHWKTNQVLRIDRADEAAGDE
jgi:hypothetical protein